MEGRRYTPTHRALQVRRVATTLPRPTKVYRNHHLDSTRWERFALRAGDIVVATSYKSGTTWMQMIVMSLLFDGSQSVQLQAMSPWLDMRLGPLHDVMSRLEGQRHRRFIKTHLPLDGLRL